MRDIIVAALFIASGALFCAAVWDAMKAREAEREAARDEARRAKDDLQKELKESLDDLAKHDELRRFSMAWSRDIDRKVWRMRFLEADAMKHGRNWLSMWKRGA